MLVDTTGPVVIDLPQAVDAASNNNAFRMLERDVNIMRETFGRSAGELRPGSPLTGQFVFDETAADVEGVLANIEDARSEAEERERRRLEALTAV